MHLVRPMCHIFGLGCMHMHACAYMLVYVRAHVRACLLAGVLAWLVVVGFNCAEGVHALAHVS